MFDVAIVGLGAMGSAAAYHLASRGAKVLGLEQFQPFHQLGSSHGDSRIIRMGYFEGEGYVPLLRRAYENWHRLEAESGRELLMQTGVLHIGPPDGAIVPGALAASRLHDLPHELLTQEQAKRRFPQFHLAPDEMALLDPLGGFLRPEAAIDAMLHLARGRGAELSYGERVLELVPGDGGLILRTPRGRYEARRVIIAAGSYVAALVPALRDVARPIRTVVGWFRPREEFDVTPAAMPCYLREVGNDSYFGFPLIADDGLKLGRHGHLFEAIDPELPNPPVNARDREVLDAFAQDYLQAAGEPLNQITCRYTLLPDDFFLIDRLPGEANVIVASPCSGHGFKFTSVIGEILTDLALDGGTSLPIDAFSFAALAERVAAGKPQDHR